MTQLAIALRDAGAATAVSRLTDTERDAIATVALGMALPFTAETLRDLLTDGLREKLDAFPNAVGGIILGLAKRGQIVPVGYVHSHRTERRKGRVCLWQVVS